MDIIAITSWNRIVSPLYDASCCLTIVNPDRTENTAPVQHLSLFDRAELCKQHGVNVLICGAISNMAQAILQDRNITVFSWVCGPVDELIETYYRGLDLYARFAMPGCTRGRCGRRRRARRQGRGAINIAPLPGDHR